MIHAVRWEWNIAEAELDEAGVQAARGTYLPSVAAFGRRELYTNDLTLQDPEWAVGLAANWALFDGFQRSSIVRQRKAGAARIKALLADGTRQIQLLVQQRHQALTTAKARLTSFEATNELAGLYTAIGRSYQLTVLAAPLPSDYSRNNPDRKSQ